VLLHAAEKAADLLRRQRARQIRLVDDDLELVEREMKGLDLVEQGVGRREVRALRQADPVDEVREVVRKDLHRKERIDVYEQVVALGQRAEDLHDDVRSQRQELLARGRK